MREIAFIRQNKEKWLEFERAIEQKKIDNPDDLSNLYMHLINDLAYAQTYYKKSKLVTYLNNLAVRVYQKIYQTKREESNVFVHFFKVEVPLLLYQYKRYILYSFSFFLIAVLMGVVSAANDDTFVRLILGNSYVNETLQNIENGDPVAIYKSGSNWGSFIGITFNNLRVGLMSFAYGVTGGIGTGYVLLQNGIMLGAFQYFFEQEGVLWKSAKGIWIHGAMEIFAIVIEGAAGFLLGASILFPKTFSRLNSFKRGMRDSIKIVISTFPFTIAAGFLEGFVTRYSNIMPNYVALFIILGTLSLISYYYLIYPFKVYKKTIPGSVKK
ncbi:putative membrane protein SpoIIM required for sporulation [Maribacter vaceletii]|uniref:Putative membrane protein SpoIIM required for sporulation n=1 Tax=Maribacter vaceletii TaxID=1206816 RepID=A0A495DSY4_9FLAO|nr:stage II sporulation protein M [Maribacter vaceletii]RKR07761.1 putative membrane protein SpoIIM required for sporulation [Maribacter vaceletii]